MRIVTTLPKNTAKRACYLCGSPSRGQYWLTGVVIDFEGQLAICIDVCLNNAAIKAGMFPAERIRELEEKVNELEEARAGLIKIAGTHAGLVAALNEAGIELGDPAEFVGAPI